MMDRNSRLRWDTAARNGRGTVGRAKCLRHSCLRFCRAWCAVFLGLMTVARAVAAEYEGQYELELAGMMPNGRDMTLMLDVRDGKVASAFGLARRYNGRGHLVVADKLTFGDRRIIGPLDITIIPDPWVPKDGKEQGCKVELDVAMENAGIAGKYVGSCAGEERKGAVTGKKLPNTGREGRYKLRLFQALRRLAPARGFTGPNVKYAIDMWLTFRIDKKGNAIDAQFETPVPDYRRYCALVESIDVDFKGAELEVDLVADVDHGGQGRSGGDTRRERYEYELKGVAIGDDVMGRYAGKVKGVRDENIPFLGSIERGDPVRPGEASAFMRMHDAMQNEYPIILFFSISDPKHIHGHAYASGYNHQPQAVDCSKLVREGNRIEGPMVVSVYPDCYHDHNVFFDMKYDIDVEIERGIVKGKFKGADRGEKTKGVITGELRRKKPPIAGPKGLAAYELSAGWVMPKAKDKSIVVRYELEDGRMSKTVVLGAKTKKPVDGLDVKSSDIAINADELKASVAYELSGRGGGKYEFAFTAKISGDRCSGFWRGKHDGKHILVKSSKSGGRLVLK